MSTETAPAPAPAALRYTREQLEAMQGKRGRKPAEFYAAFPDFAPKSKPAGAPRAPRGTGKARRVARPAISSAMLGDHTIDELCAKVGQKGSKPPAYAILQQAAQFFADHGGVTLPAPVVVTKVVANPGKPAPAAKAPRLSPLAAAVEAAPPKLRRLITAILTSGV